jgi:hypothetical protein
VLIEFDATHNVMLWDEMNVLVPTTMTMISNCLMEMDKNLYESKTPLQSPYLQLQDSHLALSHPQISPYTTLFQELNWGEWSIPKQWHFGLLGQCLDGHDVENGNDAMVIDMQG